MTVKTLKFILDVNGQGTVMLDGQPLECRSISFRQVAGELAEVSIGLLVKVDGEIMVEELVSQGQKSLRPASEEHAA